MAGRKKDAAIWNRVEECRASPTDRRDLSVAEQTDAGGRPRMEGSWMKVGRKKGTSDCADG